MKLKSRLFRSAAAPAIAQPQAQLPQLTQQQIEEMVSDAAEATRSPEPIPITETSEFKAWFSGSEVVDDDGKPLKVYHGTTHDFDRFKVKGNPEGFYGQAFYFTDSIVDVNENYATDAGADITSRIEQRAERIMEEIQDAEDTGEYFGGWGTEEHDKLYEEAKNRAKAEIQGTHKGVVMPVYLCMRKPVIVQPRGGTYFDIMFNEETGEESGSGMRLYNKFINIGWKYDFDGQDMWSKMELDPEFTAHEFEREVRGVESLLDYGGAGQIILDLYRSMGFDGIIQSAWAEFGPKQTPYPTRGMTMDRGTKHYIVWNPRQIKSAIGNKGTFNRRSPRITSSIS